MTCVDPRVIECDCVTKKNIQCYCHLGCLKLFMLIAYQLLHGADNSIGLFSLREREIYLNYGLRIGDDLVLVHGGHFADIFDPTQAICSECLRKYHQRKKER